MFKKSLVISVIAICMFCSFSYAEMTAFDLMTVPQSEWDRIDRENKDREYVENQKKKHENQQKAKDKYSGPGALESTGNIVTNPDTNNYFVATAEGSNKWGSPVADDPSDDNTVIAIDKKYGITFTNKRHYVTNLGEFDLRYAMFEEYTEGGKTRYRFRLSTNTIKKDNKNYFIYLKAYDAQGKFVDYTMAVTDPDRSTKDIILNLYENNERNVARIEFSLDTKGLDANVIAMNIASIMSWSSPNALAVINDPAKGFSEEDKAKYTQHYMERVAEKLPDAEKEVTRENAITEIVQ